MSNKKNVIIISSVAVSIIAAIVVIVLVFFVFKEDSYRIIKIFEVDGSGNVSREEIGDLEPYDNMLLESGDVISLYEGNMTLKLDEDKYVYVEPETEFELIAKGDDVNSKTTINLHEGSIANEIQNKLSDDSYYEINTPNSTMAVRGTIYYVATYVDENGVRYTKVSVFDGAVDTDLVKNGIKTGDNKLIQRGKEIIIYDDGIETDYLSEPTDIDFSGFSDEMLNYLIGMIDSGSDVEHADEIISEKAERDEYALHGDEIHTVTFMYNGSEFGHTSVQYGKTVDEPSLVPSQTGGWDFDFSTQIKEDIVINWK